METNRVRLPVGRRKHAHDVAEEIESLISSGEFAVGSQLPSERDFMERFGVGRPAVREALFVMAQHGVIEISSGKRARVIPPTGSTIASHISALMKRFASAREGQEQINQAHPLFESGLARQSAQIATGDDIARLKAVLYANVAALGNTTEFVRTDIAFHRELAVIPRNPIFIFVHELGMEWLVDRCTTTIHMPDADTLSVRDHTAICEAIAARDSARAFHEMVSHLRLASRLYAEAKRVTEEILRGVTHDVARRIDREQRALWASSFGASAEASGPTPKTARRSKRELNGGGVS
jgi:GntR family transcriptional repressor for pyruvate dehydrogenase complex